MYMYTMVRKTEIHLAVKAFAKEIRVSASLILGPVGTHKGVELRKVANEINYPLKIFERRIQWTNRVKLCIGLLKESM